MISVCSLVQLTVDGLMIVFRCTVSRCSVAKNMMLAHAKAYRAYNGTKPMGFAANADWYEPLTSCDADQQAAVNAMVWEIGLFWDLLTTGAWAPEIAQAVPHPRLPELSGADAELLRGAHGSVYYQNMYTSAYAWATGSNVGPQSDCPSPRAPWRSASEEPADFTSDSAAGKSAINPITKEPIGALAPGSSWLHFTPFGLPKLQRWIAGRYLDDIPGLKIVVTENGWGGAYPTKERAVDDLQRCEYFRQYIGNMSKFTLGKHEQGPLVLSAHPPTILGYFAWSLLDNFEWNDGYSQRFGMTYVEYCGPHNNNTCKQTRTPKMTASWFTELLKDSSFREQPPHTWKSLPECKWYTNPDSNEPAGSRLWVAVGVAALVVVSACVGVVVVRRRKRSEAQDSTEPLANLAAW